MENIKILAIVFYVILLYICIHTYYYLTQLETCVCFQKTKYINLDFMKFFQILEIFILTIYVASIFFFKSKLFKNKNKKTPVFLLSLSLILLICISAYMSINVLNLYTNIKEDCKCADSWYRFFLYYQGIISVITVFRFIAIILLLAIIFIVSKFN